MNPPNAPDLHESPLPRRQSYFNGERLVYVPRGPLGAWVEGIRIGDPPARLDAPASRRIVPDRCAHLIYYRFAAPGVLAGRRVPGGTSGLVWVGPRSVFKDIERRGRALTLIVTLKPGAAWDLIRLPMNEVADRGLPASDVLPSGVERLLERLDRVRTPASMIPIIAEELQHMRPRRNGDPMVREAVRRLTRRREPIRLRDLCRELGVGERRLREHFGRQVGLAPKRFARIRRLERIFEQLPPAATRTWSRMASEAGYADHAHMIREFNQLLGESPSRFAERLAPSA